MVLKVADLSFLGTLLGRMGTKSFTYWNAVEAQRAPYYKALTVKAQDMFIANIKAVDKAVAGTGSKRAALAAVDRALNKKVEQQWKNMLLGTYVVVGADFANRAYKKKAYRKTFDQHLMDEIGGEIGYLLTEDMLADYFSIEGLKRDQITNDHLYDLDVDDFEDWATDYAVNTAIWKSQKIVETKRNQAKRVIEHDYDGWDSAAIVGALYGGMLALSMMSASAFAITEVATASNFGMLLGQAKFVNEGGNPNITKTWITMKDNRVRDAHQPMEGETVPFDQPFEVNFDGATEELMFPGDTSLGASIGNTINCRCTIQLGGMW
jgi:hypothetical protein